MANPSDIAFPYFNLKYTNAQIDSVPYLRPILDKLGDGEAFFDQNGYYPPVEEVASEYQRTIDYYLKNPVKGAKEILRELGTSAAWHKTPDDYNKNLTNTLARYLVENRVDFKEVENIYTSGVSTGIDQRIAASKDKWTESFLKYGVPIALSFALPGMGSAIGAQLVASNLVTNTLIANAVGTAMASTALQMAQGADFDDALKNATVNAIIQTGAPSVATEINKLVKIPAVSDAITSAGASALKTAASGGSAADIERNMIGAIAGSATSSAVEYGTDGNIFAGRLAGATVGGAATGGTAGALTGFAGEYAGQKAAEEARLKESRSKMLASADGSTVSDSGESLGDVVVTGAKETPGITDTSIITPTGPISDREVMGAMKPAPISGTLKEVKVTAPKETPDITETSIVTPDSLPEVTVKGEREEEPQAQAEEESPVDEQGRYRPNLFVYGGVKPSTLPQTLSTTVEKVPTPSTTTGTSVGLGGRGEVESKESGKKRQTVWNEESLRLKDALGL